MRRVLVIAIAIPLLGLTRVSAQPQFELTNNFIANLSFITGTNRGVSQNLDDNFAWMNAQGYTHLRLFGILPNGVHFFPSATLDAHGYANSAYHESLLAVMVPKAATYGITINFDGWEVIAESNRDTTFLGVGYITADELAQIVADVLSLGVTLVTEEQFGSPYLQAIDSVCTAFGATHETTAGVWWNVPGIADQQLASVFSYYPYNQAEADSIEATSSLPANIGNVLLWLDGARYYNIPTSLAIGSFGTMTPPGWKNVCLYMQMVIRPDRFSVEEQDNDFVIWTPGFNFMNHVGDEITALDSLAFGDRPIANLVIDPSTVPGATDIPAYMTLLVNGPAIANTFNVLGYRVVTTVADTLPGADAYYILMLGGANETQIAPLPGYVEPLLNGTAPVFLHPAYGIPDATDGAGWEPVRTLFGLPSGETATLGYSIPVSVTYDTLAVLWEGATYLIVPVHEHLPAVSIDTSAAAVVLSSATGPDDIALIIAHDNKYLINSNLIHLEASYILSDLLNGPVNRPITADIAYDTDKIVIFAEHTTDIDIDIPWPGRTHQVHYDLTGDIVSDTESDLSEKYVASLSEGELVMLLRVPGICGDITGDDSITSSDIIYLVSYLFRGGPPPFDLNLADANASGTITAADAIYLVSYVFKAGPPPNCP